MDTGLLTGTGGSVADVAAPAVGDGFARKKVRPFQWSESEFTWLTVETEFQEHRRCLFPPNTKESIRYQGLLERFSFEARDNLTLFQAV